MASTVSGLFSVRDLVVVITGGGSGLGEWMAEGLAVNGAKVFILGRRAEALQRVADAVTSGSIVPIQCDLTSRDSLRLAVQQVQQQTPFINCLVSNSGMLGSVKLKQTPYADSGVNEIAKYFWATEEADSGILDINLIAPHWLFAAFLPLLHASNTHPDSVYQREHIDSQFITVSSLSALQKKTLTGYMYNASKAALLHYTKGISHDFAHLGIRANSIAPGLFVTEMIEHFFPDPVAATKRGGVPKETHPAGRSGTSEDIAGVIIYLASRAGAYVNGATLVVDGGALLMGPSVC